MVGYLKIQATALRIPEKKIFGAFPFCPYSFSFFARLLGSSQSTLSHGHWRLSQGALQQASTELLVFPKGHSLINTPYRAWAILHSNKQIQAGWYIAKHIIFLWVARRYTFLEQKETTTENTNLTINLHNYILCWQLWLQIFGGCQKKEKKNHLTSHWEWKEDGMRFCTGRH